MIDLLCRSGINKNKIRLIHHPRRGQDDKAANDYARGWIKGIGMGGNDLQRGEPANKTGAMARGSLTLKVIADESEETLKKNLRFNSGVIFAIEILNANKNISHNQISSKLP